MAEKIGLEAGVKRSVTRGSLYRHFKIKSHLWAYKVKKKQCLKTSKII